MSVSFMTSAPSGPTAGSVPPDYNSIVGWDAQSAITGSGENQQQQLLEMATALSFLATLLYAQSGVTVAPQVLLSLVAGPSSVLTQSQQSDSGSMAAPSGVVSEVGSLETTSQDGGARIQAVEGLHAEDSPASGIPEGLEFDSGQDGKNSGLVTEEPNPLAATEGPAEGVEREEPEPQDKSMPEGLQAMIDRAVDKAVERHFSASIASKEGPFDDEAIDLSHDNDTLPKTS